MGVVQNTDRTLIDSFFDFSTSYTSSLSVSTNQDSDDSANPALTQASFTPADDSYSLTTPSTLSNKNEWRDDVCESSAP